MTLFRTSKRMGKTSCRLGSALLQFGFTPGRNGFPSSFRYRGFMSTSGQMPSPEEIIGLNDTARYRKIAIAHLRQGCTGRHGYGSSTAGNTEATGGGLE